MKQYSNIYWETGLVVTCESEAKRDKAKFYDLFEDT